MTVLGPGSQFVQNLWEMSADSAEEGPKSRPATRLDHIDQLLRQIQEATLAVRRLIQAEDVALSADDLEVTGANVTPPKPAAYLRKRSEASVSRGFRHTDIEAINWDLVTRGLIRERFEEVGHVGAGVLMRLLGSPDVFVTCKELAEVAGVRSGSNRVIKVYICRLRQALTRAGASPQIIETGSGSYRLQHAAVAQIMRLLTTAQGA